MIHVHHNAACLKCRRIELEMLRIGALIMCSDCTKEEFKTGDPVHLEKAKYGEWLEKYKEQE